MKKIKTLLKLHYILLIILSSNCYAMATKVIEEKTKGAGVFKVTIENNRTSSITITIGATATSVSGGTVSTKIEGKVEIPAQTNKVITVPKPFFGEDYENFTGDGPMLGVDTRVCCWFRV